MSILREYYDKKNYKAPHYINKSLAVPLLHNVAETAYITKPERLCNRHLPWNYTLHNENVNEVFLRKAITDPQPSCVLPPIHIINLEHRYDRLAELSLHLQDVKYFILKTFKAIKRKPGYLGCALSHIALIKQAKARGDKMVIVAEDDFMPTSPANFERRLMGIVKWLSNHMGDWEVFNSIPLGYNFDYIDKVLSAEHGIVRVMAGCNTQLVVYNESCYDKLISLEHHYLEGGENAKEHYFAWDVILSRLCSMVTSVPFLTNSYSEDSDITSNGLAFQQIKKNFDAMLAWDEKNLHLFSNGFSVSSDCTMVITSGRRYPELCRTLDSFLKYNSYPLKEIIISQEDFEEVYERFRERYLEYIDEGYIRMIKGKNNHMDSLDNLYSQITTPYFFHMEDDWVCTRPFFIEQSKMIMETDPNVLCVWLRDLNDTNKHPIADYQSIGGIHCWKMAYNYSGGWHGFTFNPTLRRKKDVVSFAQFKDKGKLPEELVSIHYKDLGMYACILPVAHFYHIGYMSTYSKYFKDRHQIV